MSLLTPLRQGQLDGLCGLYSIINAIALAISPRPLPAHQKKLLFATGLESLDERAQLLETVPGGMSERRWRRLLTMLLDRSRLLLDVDIEQVHAFASGPPLSTRAAVSFIQGKVAAGSPVLACLRGAYNHFTVIAGFSDRHFYLFDSYGFRWVRIDSCTVQGSKRIARHQLPRRCIIALVAQPAGAPSRLDSS